MHESEGLNRSELRAILSVGFVGVEQLLQEDERRTLDTIKNLHIVKTERIASEHGGWVFRRETTGLWCSFPSAGQALRSIHALLVQLRNATPRIRCGVHVGDVTLTADGDCLGHTLSVAKRLETQARTEEVWISQESRERLDRAVMELFDWNDLGEVELKGVGVIGAHTATVNRRNRSVFNSQEIDLQQVKSGPGQVQATGLFYFGSSGSKDRRNCLRRLHEVFPAARVCHWSFECVTVQATTLRLLEFAFEVSQRCRSAIFSYDSDSHSGHSGPIVGSGESRWGRNHQMVYDCIVSGSEPLVLVDERLQINQNFRAEPYFARPDFKLEKVQLKAGQTMIDLSVPPPPKPAVLGDPASPDSAWANLPRDTTSTVRIQAVRLAPLVEEWSLLLPLVCEFSPEDRAALMQESPDLGEWLAREDGPVRMDLVLRQDSYGRPKVNAAWTRWARVWPWLNSLKDWLFEYCQSRCSLNSQYRFGVNQHQPAVLRIIQMRRNPNGLSIELFHSEVSLQDCSGLPAQLAALILPLQTPEVPHFVQKRSVDLHGGSPYRPWRGYSLADDYLFFGRESMIHRLSHSLTRQPWAVLYGRSGVGKSSILRAGLQSEICLPGDLWIEQIDWTSPTRSLISRLSSLATDVSLSSPVRLASQVVAQIRGRLFLVFDQMEELFRVTDPAERSRFVAGLYSLMTGIDDSWSDWGNRVRLVFCLQEESLAEFSSLEANLPGLLTSLHRLRPFIPDEAWDAFVGPCRLQGVAVENELAECLIEDLGRDVVCPTQLSICAERLWREFAGSSRDICSDAAPSQEATMRRSHYWRVGGAGEILQTPVLETLEAACLATHRGSGERTYQALALRDSGSGVGRLRRECMQLLQGFCRSKSRADLDWRELCCLTPNSLAPELMVSAGLIQLRRSGIGLDDSPESRLALDVVYQEVSQWIERELLSNQYSQQLLQTEVDNWTNHHSLLSRERFFMVERQRQELSFTSCERRLMLRAAACYSAPMDEWLESDDGDYLLSLCQEKLAKSVPAQKAIQREIVVALAQLPLEQRQVEKVLSIVSHSGTPDLLETLDMVSTYCNPDSVLNNGEFWVAIRQQIRLRFFGAETVAFIEGGPFVFGSTSQNKSLRKASSPRFLRAGIDSEMERCSLVVEPFLMDKVPITNDGFAEFFPEHGERYPDEEGQFPVVSVSFYEADAFARWLGKELPSEQEWEKAARGLEGRLYPWGDEFAVQYANGRDSARRSSCSVWAHPLGVSPFGCFDMAGNVWEWTSSNYGSQGPFKVLKGGSCLNSWETLQASSRRDGFPDFVFQQVGFRLKSSLQARDTAFEHLGRFGKEGA